MKRVTVMLAIAALMGIATPASARVEGPTCDRVCQDILWRIEEQTCRQTEVC